MKSQEEKLLADFGSQTDGCIEAVDPLAHQESRGVEAVLNTSTPHMSHSFDNCCDGLETLNNVTSC